MPDGQAQNWQKLQNRRRLNYPERLLVKGNILLLQPVEQKLRIMLIDQSDDRNQLLSGILQSVDCEVIASISTDDDILQQIETNQPDIIILDIDFPGRDVLENLRTVQATLPKPMVMFSQDDNGDSIRKAVQAGVSAYVVDDLQAHRVRPILDAAIATFDQYHLLKQQLKVTRHELDKQKKLEKAKLILMQQRNIDETNAYQIIRKTAMDKKLKIEMVEQIIQAAELLGGFDQAS